MTQFDPELYLRLAGERLLVDGGDPDGWSEHPLADAARALVAVDAIGSEPAQRVVDEYGLALAVRNHAHFHHRASLRHQRSNAPGVLEPRRVARCEARIDDPSGTIETRFALLGHDSTVIAVVFRPAPSGGSSRRGSRMAVMRGGHGFGPPDVTLADDRGTATSASFGGGGSDALWEGYYNADTPLARDAAWIEIDGHRIDLVDANLGVTVRVEPLPDEDPALAHLWRRIAAPDHFHGPPDGLETSIDALVAAGALRADEPVLDDIRAVLEATQHGPHGPVARQRRLPEPWRSLLARAGREDGQIVTAIVGAVAPSLDGISVAILSLASTRDAFSIEVEIAGDDSHAPFDTDVEQTRLAWWAADDRGNHYLGQTGSWSSGDGHSQGTVDFWPAIDPAATRLDLMPTGKVARAVIGIPLPRKAGNTTGDGS